MFSCRFLKCCRSYQVDELSKLTAHLLIHVRECSERSVRNPRFYETLLFPAVPAPQQVHKMQIISQL